MKIEEKLKNLPSSPGVYQFKEASGKVIYVGKAKNLKNRVRQYFQNTPAYGKTATMISKIADAEITITDNEVEALILEYNLIKELKPRYNVNLKDDKSYPYIVITKEPFPRIFPTRKKRSDGSRYFGPYTDVKSMRYALKIISNTFKVRSCNFNLAEESIKTGKFKVCLDYHINKCEGPCEALQTRDSYNESIEQAARLLNGKTMSLLKELNDKMKALSENMQFEKAAKLRDKIESLKVYSEKQKMIGEEIIDRDIFAVETMENDGCGMILKIRDGKVIGKTHLYIGNVIDKEENELIENLIIDYYSKTEYIPDEIFVQTELEEKESLTKWLQGKEKDKTKKVEIINPKIGEKAKLVNMVKANAKLMLDELKLAKIKKEFITPSVEVLKNNLKMDILPRRIECFDISHIQGTDTVASMISFLDGKPRKSEYRKYKIQSVLNEAGEPDDFLSIREVIYRRYKRLLEENKSLPDLIVVDGGKGQLSSAVKVLKDIGIRTQDTRGETQEGREKKENIYSAIVPVDSKGASPLVLPKSVYIIGLAKKLEEVFLPGESEAVSIPKASAGLRLLQKIRNEAHRFAITFHQSTRDKRTLTTELLKIPGIGEKTAQKLLKEIGSVELIKEKIETDFEEVKKLVGKKTAEKLLKYLTLQ
jgi:excinuclease ABC subunit C